MLVYGLCSLLSHSIISCADGLHTWLVFEVCGCVVDSWAFGRGDRGSKPHAAVSKLEQFRSRSPHFACVFWKRR